MRIDQCEVGFTVVELQLHELLDIGITALMLRMAATTLQG